MSEDTRSTRERSSPPSLASGQAQIQPHAPAIGRGRRVARLAVLALLILALAVVSVAWAQPRESANRAAPSPEGEVAEAAKAAPREADLAETSSSIVEAEASLQVESAGSGAEPVVEAPLEAATATSGESTVDEADVLDGRPDLSSRSDRFAAEKTPEVVVELPLDSISVADKMADARARAEVKRAAEAKARAEAKAAEEAGARAEAKSRAEAAARAAKAKAQAEARARAEQAARIAAQQKAATPKPVVRTATSTPRPVVRAATTTSGLGPRVVSIAMSYLGYRYSWAGASPSTGFDCRGFTYWVYLKAGRPIPITLAGQYATGRWVSRSQLQPGDLVFFQNTYKPGLSHSGIYIGGGKMINAQSESTGVVIASIDSSYWGPRFLGGRRP